MVLGLAIGRIGCLMNGCCFGATCDVESLPKIRFPAGSPPYMQQLAYGELLGMRTEAAENADGVDPPFSRKVTYVEQGSWADRHEIQVNDLITVIGMDEQRIRFLKSEVNTNSPAPVSVPLRIINSRTGASMVETADLPVRAIAVHPAQIYAAIDAFLLCCVLWFFWYFCKADGQVFALMLLLHGISRFLLELVREDELGVFGTNLTISQWISLGLIAVGIGVYGWANLKRVELDRPQASTV